MGRTNSSKEKFLREINRREERRDPTLWRGGESEHFRVTSQVVARAVPSDEIGAREGVKARMAEDALSQNGIVYSANVKFLYVSMRIVESHPVRTGGGGMNRGLPRFGKKSEVLWSVGKS